MREKYILIQARMGSKRLPGKMLMTIKNKSLIEILLSRLSKLHDYRIVVLTSNLEIDNGLVSVCENAGFTVYRGDEVNVYSRFRNFVKERLTSNSIIVRLTGDNVLIDLDLVENVVKLHLDSGKLFTSTREILEDRRIVRYLPKGQSVDVFDSKIFNFVDETNLDSFDKEHVIPCFYRFFDYTLYKQKDTESLISLSVDEKEDFESLKAFLK